MKSFFVCMLTLCLAATAGRATEITLNAVNSGWYDNNGGSNGSANNTAQAGSYFGFSYRNWFGFDLSSVSDPITSATLELYSDGNNDSGQTVSWWDVTTSYSSLGTSSLATYNDLGSGVLFGSGTHTAGTINSFVLNASAIASLNSATSFWAIGGSNNGSIAFGYTQGVGSGDNFRLVLNRASSVPDSGSTLALFGFGLGLLVWFRRNRA